MHFTLNIFAYASDIDCILETMLFIRTAGARQKRNLEWRLKQSAMSDIRIWCGFWVIA